MRRLRRLFKSSGARSALLRADTPGMANQKTLDTHYVAGSRTERAACVAILDRLIEGVSCEAWTTVARQAREEIAARGQHA